MADIDNIDEPEAMESKDTEEKEKEFAKTLIGMTITDASFSVESGYMIEFDHKLRFRSCCPHSAFYRRIIQ